MANYILQLVNDRSPGTASFSMGGNQVATETYILRPQLEEGDMTLLVREFVKDVLGSCEAAGDGSLERTLPKAHPQFPHMFAQEISSFIGVGVKDTGTGRSASLADAYDENDLEAPPIVNQFWQYPAYQVQIKFASVNYAVLTDDQISADSLTWTLPDGSAQTNAVADEYIRFTEFDYEVADKIVYAQHGQLKFYDLSDPPGERYTFSGFPRMAVPTANIRFRWYMVPFDYLTSDNSYFSQYVNHVNQDYWYGWDPGTLLFKGVRVIRKFTPPMPDRVVLSYTGTDAFSRSKLVDLEFIFEETVREPGGTLPEGNNDNQIVAGHNLQPLLGRGDIRGFYYVTTPDENATYRVPIFNSVPFALLFSDPDA